MFDEALYGMKKKEPQEKLTIAECTILVLILIYVVIMSAIGTVTSFQWASNKFDPPPVVVNIPPRPTENDFVIIPQLPLEQWELRFDSKWDEKEVWI